MKTINQILLSEQILTGGPRTYFHSIKLNSTFVYLEDYSYDKKPTFKKIINDSVCKEIGILIPIFNLTEFEIQTCFVELLKTLDAKYVLKKNTRQIFDGSKAQKQVLISQNTFDNLGYQPFLGYDMLSRTNGPTLINNNNKFIYARTFISDNEIYVMDFSHNLGITINSVGTGYNIGVYTDAIQKYILVNKIPEPIIPLFENIIICEDL